MHPSRRRAVAQLFNGAGSDTDEREEPVRVAVMAKFGSVRGIAAEHRDLHVGGDNRRRRVKSPDATPPP